MIQRAGRSPETDPAWEASIRGTYLGTDQSIAINRRKMTRLSLRTVTTGLPFRMLK